MQYYALVNTASPATGFISIGEVLTDKQAEALGDEKIVELVREKVLAPCGAEKPAEEEQTEPAAEETQQPEPDDEEEAADGEDEEELPELELTEEIVKDQAEETPAEEPKICGRREAK